MAKGLMDMIIDSIFDDEWVGKRGEKLTERELKLVKLFGRKGRTLRRRVSLFSRVKTIPDGYLETRGGSTGLRCSRIGRRTGFTTPLSRIEPTSSGCRNMLEKTFHCFLLLFSLSGVS